MKEKDDEYFKLNKQRYDLEEQEDGLKQSKKLIGDLSQSSEEFMLSFRKIKENENDILGSDYANEITSINDELNENSKVLKSLISEMDKEVNMKLKANSEQQEEIVKAMIAREKGEEEDD